MVYSPASLLLDCMSKAGRSKSKFLDELLLELKICASRGMATAGMAVLDYCYALAREVSQ